MTIIPAIDIIDGRCVRLTQGDYSACKVYGDDPVEIARGYGRAGFTRLHVVDLDGARAGRSVNLAVLQRICRETTLAVDFGGGIHTDGDIEQVFAAGAAMACVGSLAVTDVPRVRGWLQRYGGDRIILGADVKDERVCIHGWKTVTDTTVYQLAEQYAPFLKYSGRVSTLSVSYQRKPITSPAKVRGKCHKTVTKLVCRHFSRRP